MTSIIERFEEAIALDQELPIISATEFAELLAEAEAAELSEHERSDLNAGCRYKGRGFGVDMTLTAE